MIFPNLKKKYKRMLQSSTINLSSFKYGGVFKEIGEGNKLFEVNYFILYRVCN